MYTRLSMNKGMALFGLFLLVSGHAAFGQSDSSVSPANYLYRPSNRQAANSNLQATDAQYQSPADTTFLFIQQPNQDSILAREKFIRDSIQKREHILDSLNFLKKQLPRLLQASLLSQSDKIIAFSGDISIHGDSVLNNFVYMYLPFSFDQPYMPWRVEIPFSGKLVKIGIDTVKKLITSLSGQNFTWNYLYTPDKQLTVIKTTGVFFNKYGKNYYRQPFDSLFYDKAGNLVKIKRYSQIFQANDKYQKGNFLFNVLLEVRQYQYGANQQVTAFDVVDFCDRWAATDPEKVCTIIRYTLERKGNAIALKRANEPTNNFSDGIFNFEFDEARILRSVSFANNSNSENWKTMIEYNTDGNVSRYAYQVKGKINRTLLVNYYLDNPSAPHKVETITCTFEDDGISYYQKNNTTGKARIRDHFTAEWGPWQ